MRFLCRLILVASMLLATAVTAQISIPGMSSPGADKKAADVETIAQKRERIQARIAEAERRRDESQLMHATYQGEEAVLATEQQRMLERLVVVEHEKLKRLNELEIVQKQVPPGIESLPQVRELSGPPPYSALRVDALRDILDTLNDKLLGMNSRWQSFEAEKQDLTNQRRRAAEAMRQADDRQARARSEDEAGRARWGKELAGLQQQVADAELVALTLGQDTLKLQTAALRKHIEELERFVERVLPGQRLSEVDMEEVRARAKAAGEKLKAETDSTIALHGRRLAERDRLLREGVAQRGGADEKAMRLRFLDDALETDLIVLRGLSWMQLLAQHWLDAAEQRYLALNGNAEVRQLALAAMQKLKEPLSDRRRLSNEQREALRLAIREQETRIANSAPGGPENRYANELLGLLQKRSMMFERVEVIVSQLERQLARWEADLGASSDESAAARWARLGSAFGRWLAVLWHYELFTVEDTSEVDGHKVPVSYGVTVDKSVGALLLIILGYWALSRVSRLVQRVMVRRFGVEEQLAQVVRRWLVIFLAIVLAVFVLNLARIPLTVFAFLGGALAIGIGFGTQTIIKNLISGIIILFERKIRVGDIVNIGGTTGHVVAVDLRATTIRAFDGVEALVPNSIILENQVVNWTYSNPRIRQEIRIGVAYGTDTRQASAILAECARMHVYVLSDPVPEVFFEDYGDNALLLVLVFWVELGPLVGGRRVASDLRHAIGDRFAEAGIGVPFPQREIRLDVSSPLPVRLTTG